MEKLIPELHLYFAAPIPWYTALLGAEKLVLLNETHFPSKPYSNKMEFTGSMGKQSFSIPLIAGSRKADHKSVEISYSEKWQNHIINALRSAYGKSPYFEYYDYRIEALLRTKFKFLWDLNFELLHWSLDCLKMPINIEIRTVDERLDMVLPEIEQKPYYQVFADTKGFVPGLSILDLLFNEGIDAGFLLQEMKI